MAGGEGAAPRVQPRHQPALLVDADERAVAGVVDLAAQGAQLGSVGDGARVVIRSRVVRGEVVPEQHGAGEPALEAFL